MQEMSHPITTFKAGRTQSLRYVAGTIRDVQDEQVLQTARKLEKALLTFWKPYRNVPGFGPAEKLKTLTLQFLKSPMDLLALEAAVQQLSVLETLTLQMVNSPVVRSGIDGGIHVVSTL